MVLGVDERDFLHPVVAGEGRRALEFRRLLPLVLGLGDDAQHQTRRKDLFVQTHVAQDVLHHALGVARVVDRKAPVEAKLFDVAPENAAAGGVEGHGPHVQRFGAQHPRQTLLGAASFAALLVNVMAMMLHGATGRSAHSALRRGPSAKAPARLRSCSRNVTSLLADIVGDLRAVGGAARIGDQIGNALDQNGRFAASGSGQKQQRPLCRQSGLKLHIIEAGKAGCDHGPPCAQKSVFKFSVHNGTHCISDAVILKHSRPCVKYIYEAQPAPSFRCGSPAPATHRRSAPPFPVSVRGNSAGR